MTIKQAAIQVLQEASSSLTIDQIYERICAQSLFEFKAAKPKAVLSRQLRKHTEGVTMKLASTERCFRVSPENKYSLIQ